MKVRFTAAAPPDFRQNMTYRTRHLRAVDDPADVIDVSPHDAEPLLKAKWAEPIVEGRTVARRGRPPKAKEQEESSTPEAPKAKKNEEDGPYLNRQQLLDLVEERGLELPAGYVTRDELLAIVEAAESK